MSALPAWAAQFKDRSTLHEGLAADIVVYDLPNLKLLPIEVAYDLPAGEWRRIQKAEGYRHILVNGIETVQDGTHTGATPLTQATAGTPEVRTVAASDTAA